MMKRFFNYISSVIARLFIYLFRNISRNTMFNIAKYIGIIMWYVLPKRAKIAQNAVEYHLEYAPEKAKKLAKENFIQNIISFSEIAYVNIYTEEFFTQYVHIAQPLLCEKICALAKERSIVCTTGHLGSWELLPPILSSILNKNACIVSRTTKNVHFDTVVREARQYPNVVELSHRNSARKMLKLLREGYILGLLIDHNSLRQDSIFVPFFKEKASVPVGPAFIINKTNALCLPVVLIRRGSKLELHMKEPLDPNTLPVENREYAIAEFYTKSMEEFVREFPEQWFWMHKRWKTKEKE